MLDWHKPDKLAFLWEAILPDKRIVTVWGYVKSWIWFACDPQDVALDFEKSGYAFSTCWQAKFAAETILLELSNEDNPRTKAVHRAIMGAL